MNASLRVPTRPASRGTRSSLSASQARSPFGDGTRSGGPNAHHRKTSASPSWRDAPNQQKNREV